MSWETIFNFFRRLQAFVDRPWYLPLIATLGGLDLFVLVIPTDGLLISYVMLRPKTWIRAFILTSLGCAIGALALAILIQSGAEWFTYEKLSQSVGADTWQWVDGFVENHGTLALGALAILPIPQFPGIVVAALMGMPLSSIFISVLVGRLLKFAVLAYAASHAPRLLMKIPVLRKEITTFTEPPTVP